MQLHCQRLLAPLAVIALLASACSSSAINNIISGGKAQTRLIDASPRTTGPLSLVVASTTINSGLSAATPVGAYAQVGAGIQSFQVVPTSIPAINKNVAPSTFYTVAVLGEPGSPNYGEFIFQDTNSLQSTTGVRFKVNDAAPLVGPIDVYVYQGATLPPTPSVAGLTVGNDSGSIPSPPGNSYIPPLGATSLPAGMYVVTVTAAGAPSTVFFTGAAPLSAGNSYSYTVEDDPSASTTSAKVILAIDQPPVATNQSNMLH